MITETGVLAIALASTAGIVCLAAGLAIFMAGRSHDAVTRNYGAVIERFETIIAAMRDKHDADVADLIARNTEASEKAGAVADILSDLASQDAFPSNQK